jgi:hypothetical protein
MLERLSVATTESVRATFKGGLEVVARKIETPRPIPGLTARHEAAHVVAASAIVEADIIPRGDTLGTTRPVRMTAATAAAAGAMGYQGTGWDRFLTENYLDVPWNSAINASQAVLSDKKDLLEEVATTLEEEKSIRQYHVEAAKKRVAEKRQGIYPVILEIYQSGKKVRSVETKSFHGEVVIPAY